MRRRKLDLRALEPPPPPAGSDVRELLARASAVVGLTDDRLAGAGGARAALAAAAAERAQIARRLEQAEDDRDAATTGGAALAAQELATRLSGELRGVQAAEARTRATVDALDGRRTAISRAAERLAALDAVRLAFGPLEDAAAALAGVWGDVNALALPSGVAELRQLLEPSPETARCRHCSTVHETPARRSIAEYRRLLDTEHAGAVQALENALGAVDLEERSMAGTPA